MHQVAMWHGQGHSENTRDHDMGEMEEEACGEVDEDEAHKLNSWLSPAGQRNQNLSLIHI